MRSGLIDHGHMHDTNSSCFGGFWYAGFGHGIPEHTDFWLRTSSSVSWFNLNFEGSTAACAGSLQGLLALELPPQSTWAECFA